MLTNGYANALNNIERQHFQQFIRLFKLNDKKKKEYGIACGW